MTKTNELRKAKALSELLTAISSLEVAKNMVVRLGRDDLGEWIAAAKLLITNCKWCVEDEC